MIWSFDKLKEINPQLGFYFADVVKGEKTGEGEVTFTFAAKGNRELPHIMGQLPVYPKHWWEGKDASGKQRNIAEPTIEPPLGSGPTRSESSRRGVLSNISALRTIGARASTRGSAPTISMSCATTSIPTRR